ncbi:MAG: hypothetical protein JKY52_15135 [Flavobacteriales bacterium]|nr:hypothetical protein [Flavobacteriales bacterium]
MKMRYTCLSRCWITLKTRSGFAFRPLAGLLSLLFFTSVKAQVGIGITTPDPSAILHMVDTQKGMIISNMTTTQRDAIVSPANSLMIFNTTDQCFQAFINGQWQNTFCDLGCAVAPASPGVITGNATPCENATGVTYSIAQIPGTTAYTWTAPVGATITGGQGTTAILVDYGSTSGSITVSAINACGASVPQTLTITVNPVPVVPTATAATNIAATSLDANWAASVGATTYYLDVDDNSDFSSPLGGYNNLNTGNVLNYSVTGLTCVTTYYYRVRAENACGTSSNSNTITVTTPSCWSCGDPITDARDGKTYNTVLIGTQCWMAENLNYGTYVPVTTGGQAPAGTQKFCQNLSGVNDPTCSMGGLYEWDEMMDGAGTCNGTGAPPNDGCVTPVQGVCLAGWHVPSHYEWVTLEKNVGSNPGAFPYDVTTAGFLGTDEGGNIKVTPICGSLPCWNTPNTGATNSSGFSVLPGGAGVSSSSSFLNVGNTGYWWCSTENSGTNVWARLLDFNNAKLSRNTLGKTVGLSVRCIQD